MLIVPLQLYDNKTIYYWGNDRMGRGFGKTKKKFCCKNVILSEQTRSSFKLTLKHQASLMEELLKKRYHKQTTKQPSSKNAGTIDTRA